HGDKALPRLSLAFGQGAQRHLHPGGELAPIGAITPFVRGQLHHGERLTLSKPVLEALARRAWPEERAVRRINRNGRVGQRRARECAAPHGQVAVQRGGELCEETQEGLGVQFGGETRKQSSPYGVKEALHRLPLHRWPACVAGQRKLAA